MDQWRVAAVRAAEVAGTWLAVSFAAVVLFDDLLFGVSSAFEPRIVEAAVGVVVGIMVCLGISYAIGNYPKFAPIA
ncbi:MAG: hypothetical protein JW839_23035, partial [Candidatus Lokiarchaeota archaeon]|nr:hypothetical protein [Candidatus Lokiarchaeota archaeon]